MAQFSGIGIAQAEAAAIEEDVVDPAAGLPKAFQEATFDKPGLRGEFIEAAQADLAAQKGEGRRSIAELNEEFAGLVRLGQTGAPVTQDDINTYVQESLNGVNTIGGQTITPEVIKFIQIPENQDLYRTRYQTENFVRRQTGLAVPFYDKETKTIRLPAAFANVRPEFKEAMTAVVQDSVDLANVLDTSFNGHIDGDPTTIPLMGQEALLNAVSQGSFQKEWIQGMSDLPGDFMRGLPDFPALVIGATKALTYDQIVDIATGQDRSVLEAFNKNMEGYALFGPRQFYENVLNSTPGFRSASISFNKTYKNIFYKQFENPEIASAAFFEAHKDWYMAHPRLEEVVGEDGEVTLRQAGLDENGMPDMNPDSPTFSFLEYQVPQNLVRETLDLAFVKLPAHEKGIVFFSTMAPITYGFTAANMHKAGRYQNVVRVGRESGNYSPEMSDVEVFKAERKRRIGAIGTGFSNTWNAVTLNFLSGGIGGMLQRREMSDAHVRALDNYDRDIAQTSDRIDDLEEILNRGTQVIDGKDVKLTPDDIKGFKTQLAAERKALDSLTSGLSNYKLRMGASRSPYNLNSPFMRELMFDDVLISGAIAYGSELLSGQYTVSFRGEDIQVANFTPETAEAINSIVMPLVAPIATRKIAGGVWKLGNLMTAQAPRGAVDTLNAIGSTLHIIPTDALLSANATTIKRILSEGGVQPTDETLNGIITLQRILNAMEPQYRERAYQGLIRYNRTMRNLQGEMEKLGLDDEQIAGNMDTLSLTLAQATGLGPLIAMQQSAGAGQISARDLLRPKKLREIMETFKTEEDLIKGMELNIGLFIDNIEKQTGTKITSNKLLMETALTVTGMVDTQRLALRNKKDAIRKQIDQLYAFAADEGEIDEGAVARILEINQGLVPEGELIDNIWSAREIIKIRNRLLDSISERTEAVGAFFKDLSTEEMNIEINRLAESAHAVVTGSRKAQASLPFLQMNSFKTPDGNSITVDVSKLSRKLRTFVEGFEEEPISFFFKGGKKYMSQSGSDMAKMLDRMAIRGLLEAGYDRKSIQALLAKKRQQLRKKGVDPLVYSFADMAFEMTEDAARRGKEVNYFLARPSDAEKISRFFRERAMANTKKGDRDVAIMFDQMDEVLRAELGSIDAVSPDGTETTMVDILDAARSNYRSVMGEPSSAGTINSKIASNRTYSEALTPQPGGTMAKYKKTHSEGGETPVGVFRRVQSLMNKAMAPGTSDEAFSKILLDLANERERLMEMMGGTVIDNRYGFDLRESGTGFADPREIKSLPERIKAGEQADQALVLKTIERLLNIAGQAGLSGKMYTEMKEQTTGVTRLILEKGEAKNIRNSSNNWKRASRVQQMEAVLTIPIINRNGKKSADHRLFDSGAAGDFAKDFDRLLAENDQVRLAFDQVRTELLDETGALRVAAETELGIESERLQAVQQFEKRVRDPIAFGETFFENRTIEEFNADVMDFVAKSRGTDRPMSEDEVRTFMRYQFTRYLMAKAGLKSKYTTRSDEPVQNVSDIDVLINQVANGERRDFMAAVMGEDLTRHLEDISMWATYASGDGMGLRGMNRHTLMSLESAFARAFNIARGMVSIPYVATEVSARIALHRNFSLVKLALSDRKAADIMARMLRSPEGGISKEDIRTLGLRLRNYMAKELIVSGGELPTVDQIIEAMNLDGSGAMSPISSAGTPSQIIEEQDPNEELLRRQRQRTTLQGAL